VTSSPNFQDEFYSGLSDYRIGSPHLAYLPLYNYLVEIILGQLHDLTARSVPLDVVEVGAGHGAFTGPLLTAGARVTALEMAEASAAVLSSRFGDNASFSCLHDPDGSFTSLRDNYSLALCVSVLHHIPDYLGSLTELTARIRPGGSLIALHEPLWYPRARKAALYLNKVGYLSWRLGQGDLRRGLATQARRVRGKYDEANASDMVEYHVVRDGVDEESIAKLLSSSFEKVEIIRYWSNQSMVIQRLGRRLSLENTFGLVASGRRDQI
jgi:SAM-dependent methyltransferase